MNVVFSDSLFILALVNPRDTPARSAGATGALGFNGDATAPSGDANFEDAADARLCYDKAMNEWLQRIELHPRVCNGKPVIRDTRIPVHVLVEQIAAGETWEHLLKGYPGLQREDLQAALLYASVTMERLDFVAPLAA